MWLVRLLFWLQAFIAPVLVSGLLVLAFWRNSHDYTFPVIAISIGAIVGVIAAEYIRQKIGLDVFFARIYGPNQMDKKKEGE
jgi:hypothetical protein